MGARPRPSGVVVELGIAVLTLLAAVGGLGFAWLAWQRAGTAEVASVLRAELAEARREAADQDARLRRELADALVRLQQQVAADAKASRAEVIDRLSTFQEQVAGRFEQAGKLQRDDAERLRLVVQERLETLQRSNEAKLEAMQRTVDEKLQSTLEKRLAESFGLVQGQLAKVHEGLGEMQKLAAGVGDLKRVLTNVKTRGTWGEYALGNLLEQVLTADQYEANVKVRKRAEARVEYAIRLPGPDDGGPVWLPIDAKFPKEDYERLVDAADRADPVGVEEAQRALEARVLGFARDVRDKYVAPPETTDFAILFVPTEGLYAELARRPGLLDRLQHEKVVLAGPSTMLSVLNSLQMGFRTLAIQKKSAEVWRVLGAVKTEFGRFGEWLDKVQTKLASASDELEKVTVRTKQLSSKLRTVEALPETEAAALVGADPPED